MRRRLWFIVPAHGRLEIATVCLRQLRRTCDTLNTAGLEASAVVIADDENLRLARDLGFDRIRRDNDFMGRKLNDGYELAGTKRNADYMIPIGTDDWIEPVLDIGAAPAAQRDRKDSPLSGRERGLLTDEPA